MPGKENPSLYDDAFSALPKEDKKSLLRFRDWSNSKSEEELERTYVSPKVFIAFTRLMELAETMIHGRPKENENEEF